MTPPLCGASTALRVTVIVRVDDTCRGAPRGCLPRRKAITWCVYPPASDPGDAVERPDQIMPAQPAAEPVRNEPRIMPKPPADPSIQTGPPPEEGGQGLPKVWDIRLP